MLVNLFRSRKCPTSKGKTIKKSEPTDGSQGRRDLHSDKENDHLNVVDSSSVGAWVKESAVENADGAGLRTGVVLKDFKKFSRPTLVNGVQARSDVATEEKVVDEEPEDREVTATTVQESEPAERKMLDLVIGQQDMSSRYFTQRYARAKDYTVPTFTSGVSIDISNNSLVLLPELDPHAFDLYQIWLHTGTIHLRCQETCYSSLTSDSRYLWQSCWPLINAHILGCAIDAPGFSD